MFRLCARLRITFRPWKISLKTALARFSKSKQETSRDIIQFLSLGAGSQLVKPPVLHKWKRKCNCSEQKPLNKINKMFLALFIRVQHWPKLEKTTLAKYARSVDQIQKKGGNRQ